MILNNDQIQFSEKHGKFRDREKPYYFLVKIDIPNHFSSRIVLEIGSIPIEQMDESQAEILIIFE